MSPDAQGRHPAAASAAPGGMPPDARGRHPMAAWAASGGMWLTGRAGGPPRPGGAGALAAAERWAVAFEELSPLLGRPVHVDAATLLFGRAALAGFTRQGRTSAGGRCRLLAAADGWVAVHLARPDDEASVPAVVAIDDPSDPGDPGDPWDALAAFAAATPAGEVADRCQLLGVPAAALPPAGAPPRPLPPVHVAPGRRALDRRLLVVDLSAMWAGPLCAHLLGRAGARVVKVESTHRPDGARAGVPAFFDWLHAGHESVAVDLRTDGGRAALRRLLARADVVVESSRPRALRQLGIDAAEVVAATGCTWVGITGYGRAGPGADRVAFGDDAAVAGGLVATDEHGDPVFCADAVADPLTGIFAAAATAAAVLGGGGTVLDVAMRDVAGDGEDGDGGAEVVARPGGGWEVRVGGLVQEVLPPRPPAIQGVAPALGEHTDAVLAEPAARP